MAGKRSNRGVPCTCLSGNPLSNRRPLSRILLCNTLSPAVANYEHDPGRGRSLAGILTGENRAHGLSLFASVLPAIGLTTFKPENLRKSVSTLATVAR